MIINLHFLYLVKKQSKKLKKKKVKVKFSDFNLTFQKVSHLFLKNSKLLNNDLNLIQNHLPFYQFVDFIKKKNIKSEEKQNGRYYVNFGYNFKELYTSLDRNLFFNEDNYLLRKINDKNKFFLYNSLFMYSKFSKYQSLRFINFLNLSFYFKCLKQKKFFSNYLFLKKFFLKKNKFSGKSFNSCVIFR